MGCYFAEIHGENAEFRRGKNKDTNYTDFTDCCGCYCAKFRREKLIARNLEQRFFSPLGKLKGESPTNNSGYFISLT